MSMNLRFASSPNGTKNVFDREWDFVSMFGAVGNGVTSNNTALDSFNAAYAAVSGRTRLIIPPLDFAFASTMTWGALGGDKLTISAPGATLRCPAATNGFANSGPANTNTGHANISMVGSGAYTVSLTTPAQTSRFSVNQWVLVTNGDMQGYGYPQNPWKFEFKQIQSIGTGTLTFTAPLDNSYESTYPNYAAGDAVNLYQGGPATVYALRPEWNQEIELQGATLTDTGNGFYGKCRVARWTDCTFATYGPFPTMCVLFTMLRGSAAGTGGVEVDKCAHRVEFIGCNPRAVDFQSASINELYVSDVTQSPNARWRGGAGKSNYFKNLNTGTFNFGEMNYGAMGPTYMENVVASSADWFSSNFFPFSDFTEEGGGVISYAGGPGTVSVPNSYFAVPGANCVLLDASNGFARSFQILDVTATGGRTYVSTNLPYPLPSTINGKSAPWRIANHPCADLTMVNCSGNSLFTAQSALPAHSPLFGWTL